jgi:hypothetical protein
MKNKIKLMGWMGILVLSLSAGVARAQTVASPGTYSFSFGPDFNIVGIKQMVDHTNIFAGFLVAPVARLGKTSAVWTITAHLSPGASTGIHCHPGPLLICVDPKSTAPFVHNLSDGSSIPTLPGNCLLEKAFEIGESNNPSANGDVYLNISAIVPEYATPTGYEFLEFFFPEGDSRFGDCS